VTCRPGCRLGLGEVGVEASSGNEVLFSSARYKGAGRSFIQKPRIFLKSWCATRLQIGEDLEESGIDR